MANPANLSKASAASGGESRLLDEFIIEGLVEGDFVPTGETEREKRKSIGARAYVNWCRRNVNEVWMMNVEECRTAFLERHGGPHQFGGGETRALPRGDAWEGDANG